MFVKVDIYRLIINIKKWKAILYCRGDKVSILTNREKQIFELLINNHTTKEIASILRITDKTVRNHISNVILRLDVNGRTQAIIKLIQMKELKI